MRTDWDGALLLAMCTDDSTRTGACADSGDADRRHTGEDNESERVVRLC